MPGRVDNFIGAWFMVEFGTHISGNFSEVSGLASESENVKIIQVAKDGKKIQFHKPGNLKVGNVTIKRRVTAAVDMWEWRKLVEEGKIEKARCNGTITLHSLEGTPIGVWNITNAWPSEISGPDLNAGTNDTAMETLVISCEAIEREK